MQSKNSNASASKADILSDLAATRNIIRKKFKQAYTERKERERKVNELLSPMITKAAKVFKNDDKKDDSFDVENSQPNAFKPRKLSAFKPQRLWKNSSTPKSILRKGKSKNSTFGIDSFYTPEHTSKPMQNVSGNESDYSNISLPKSTKNFSKNGNNEYTIVADDEPLDRYDHPPKDDSIVQGYRISPLSGETEHVKDLFKNAPKDVQEKWVIERRKLKYQLPSLFDSPPKPFEPSTSSQSKSLEAITLSPPKPIAQSTRNRLSLRVTDPATGAISKTGQLLKKKSSKSSSVKRGDGFDFNFVRYCPKNMVIPQYFNDPNELVSRLKLLILSKKAGNSNHSQEIHSIIEELRELKCIH